MQVENPSAEILLFTGPRRASPGRDAPGCSPPPPRVFAPGQAVVIASWDWELGEGEVPATVVRQSGDWVHLRIPGFGDYSAHASVVHAAGDAGEAA